MKHEGFYTSNLSESNEAHSAYVRTYVRTRRFPIRFLLYSLKAFHPSIKEGWAVFEMALLLSFGEEETAWHNYHLLGCRSLEPK